MIGKISRRLDSIIYEIICQNLLIGFYWHEYCWSISGYKGWLISSVDHHIPNKATLPHFYFPFEWHTQQYSAETPLSPPLLELSKDMWDAPLFQWLFELRLNLHEIVDPSKMETIQKHFFPCLNTNFIIHVGDIYYEHVKKVVFINVMSALTSWTPHHLVTALNTFHKIQVSMGSGFWFFKVTLFIQVTISLGYSINIYFTIPSSFNYTSIFWCLATVFTFLSNFISGAKYFLSACRIPAEYGFFLSRVKQKRNCCIRVSDKRLRNMLHIPIALNMQHF